MPTCTRLGVYHTHATILYDTFPLLERYCFVVCTTEVAIVAIVANLRSVLLVLTDSTNLVKF